MYIGIAPSFNASCSKQKASNTFLFWPIDPRGKKKSNVQFPPLFIPEQKGNYLKKRGKKYSICPIISLYKGIT